jgi:DNA-binding MurR/RpiR family transcriptional regulator
LIELDESTTTDDIVKTMVGITHESIEGLAKVIDRTALEAAVETIATARHIVICGVGLRESWARICNKNLPVWDFWRSTRPIPTCRSFKRAH